MILSDHFETTLFFASSAFAAFDEFHLGTVLADLHQFNLVPVRIVGPALPVEIRTLLGWIILGSSGFQHLLPGFPDIVHGDADMEEPDVLIFVRDFLCPAVEQLDELSAPAVNIYDPRFPVLRALDVEGFFEPQRVLIESDGFVHVFYIECYVCDSLCHGAPPVYIFFFA